jgi:hypothetical protein
MGSFPYVIRVFVVRRLTARREYFFSVSALNDVDDNDNLDDDDSIVTESEQEYFLNFSSNVQWNQDGGAAGPPASK